MIDLVQKLLLGPSCEEVMESLQAYLDDELDERESKRLAKHLSRCTRCSNESTVYQNIKQSIQSRQQPIDPDIKAALEKFSSDLIS